MTKKKRWALILLLLLLICGTAGILVNYLVSSEPKKTQDIRLSNRSVHSPMEPNTVPVVNAPLPSNRSSGSINTPDGYRSNLQSGPSTITFSQVNEAIVKHISRVLTYVYSNIHPDTRLSYSLPGDRRLAYWSVVYDDAMRAMVHLNTDDIENAKRTINYFMENTAIQKTGWYIKEGQLKTRYGWVVNIVDAAEPREGGRGIEHIAHVGPNVFLGIAAVHLYHATHEKKYLSYARNRWQLVKDLQNEDPNDFNYGGIRMGPMGDPFNEQEQRLEFKTENPSFYQLYNGEHAADFRAFCELLEKVDPVNLPSYRHAADLIAIWDHKIYDKSKHLFAIGTTEVKFYDPNFDEWMTPGVMKIFPLDTNALKINTYGLAGLEQFEVNGAEKIRSAIENNFKVTVNAKIAGSYRTVTGYDFVGKLDRNRIVLFVEEGPAGDMKMKKGIGRAPMLTDEWSNWVALSDLRLAKDFIAKGDRAKAGQYWELYKNNAYIQGLMTADIIDNNSLAYPYAHPLPDSLNKPVGFGWNTHHAPYSIIGGVSRIMGLLGFDPFSLDPPQFIYKKQVKKFEYAQRNEAKSHQSLITEAEEYINRAWGRVILANRHGPDEKEQWRRAAMIVEKMLSDHRDWAVIAEKQNGLAKASESKFPLMGLAPLSPRDLEPVYRKFWALYHIGTGEFIRVMAYSRIAILAKRQGNRREQLEAELKERDAATKIVKNYYYSQAFDDSNGWMWQPINSLKEYVAPSILKGIEGYQLVDDSIHKES